MQLGGCQKSRLQKPPTTLAASGQVAWSSAEVAHLDFGDVQEASRAAYEGSSREVQARDGLQAALIQGPAAGEERPAGCPMPHQHSALMPSQMEESLHICWAYITHAVLSVFWSRNMQSYTPT